MKDALGLFITIKNRLEQIYWQKMDLSLCTQDVYKFLPLKCLRYTRTCRQIQCRDLTCVRQSHYNLRKPNHFAIPSINFVCHGSESKSNVGPRIWNLIPDRVKVLNCISSFKQEIKRWQSEFSLCRLCKTNIPGVGLL